MIFERKFINRIDAYLSFKTIQPQSTISEPSTLGPSLLELSIGIWKCESRTNPKMNYSWKKRTQRICFAVLCPTQQHRNFPRTDNEIIIAVLCCASRVQQAKEPHNWPVEFFGGSNGGGSDLPHQKHLFRRFETLQMKTKHGDEDDNSAKPQNQRKRLAAKGFAADFRSRQRLWWRRPFQSFFSLLLLRLLLLLFLLRQPREQYTNYIFSFSFGGVSLSLSLLDFISIFSIEFWFSHFTAATMRLCSCSCVDVTALACRRIWISFPEKFWNEIFANGKIQR